MKEIEVGAIYKHFKGKDHKVIALARDSETLEEMVVYMDLYDSPEFGNNAMWVRPKKMFLENVIVNGVEVERFKKQ